MRPTEARSGGTALAAIGAALCLGFAQGCSGDDNEGFHWDITAKSLSNECTADPLNYSEKLEYRVVQDGQDIEVAVGSDVFATGTINGCNVVYESVVWGDIRNDYELRWRLTGAAVINTGGGSCKPGNGTDWDGVEVFEIVNSEDPAISPGCEAEVALSGKFTGLE